ncbi:O-Glycosyl hydrolases family 17 protein [Wolffia australiana]
MAAGIYLVSFLLFLNLRGLIAVETGVFWGTESSQPLPPEKVAAGMLKRNNISRVMIRDADPLVLRSLSRTGISVVIGVPNDMLETLNLSRKAAESWVQENVTRHITGNAGAGDVRIEYVAVGDEPFLQRNRDKYAPFAVGAAVNIRLALAAATPSRKVKVVVPCNADVILTNASLPSSGHFRVDLNKTMGELLAFLADQGAPFVVNVDPFLILQQSQTFTLDQALFRSTPRPLCDGSHVYADLFSAVVDSLASALTKAGHTDMDIMVGKIGWPTDGAVAATVANAQTFMSGLIDWLGGGTPLRPKQPPLGVYVFSLLDENRLGDGDNGVSRHYGVFTFDGQAKYSVDLGQGSKPLAGAAGVDYLPSRWCVADGNKDLVNASVAAADVCSTADCSALASGGSCGNLTWPGNVSYAFNSYYQLQGQRANSCDFGGIGLVTTVDPSVGECRFLVGVRASAPPTSVSALVVLVCWSLLSLSHLVHVY